MTVTELLKRCAGPGCPAGTAAGSPLCRTCATRLGQALRRLPTLYQQCGERHLRSPAPAWERPPRAGRPGPSGPLHAGAADARHAIETVLASWAGLTAQATGAPAPRRVVADLSRFLLGRFGFLVRHPAAGDLAAEVSGLVSEAERVLRPESGRHLGACVVPGCEGHLAGGRGTERLRVICDADAAHEWNGPEVLSLVAESPAPREPAWISAAGITALWGVTRGTVYRLASEDKWRRQRRAGRTYYATEDVRNTLA
ncbi:hypothetical protein [Couchioplanes caeruleus]|uniref:Helix-turn-helix domain-containing protein n=2 Tax=Couchioplanes caeruleus TaxID=56438 RepID=A0A1K0H1S5_9ACTN|nr:hypothetical protein [Couchioplanes caeruleus]OJF15651.1 hypothetical protein BG844_03330 [Couchioplanes caeruleus subsp. caeruleus]